MAVRGLRCGRSSGNDAIGGRLGAERSDDGTAESCTAESGSWPHRGWCWIAYGEGLGELAAQRCCVAVETRASRACWPSHAQRPARTHAGLPRQPLHLPLVTALLRQDDKRRARLQQRWPAPVDQVLHSAGISPGAAVPTAFCVLTVARKQRCSSGLSERSSSSSPTGPTQHAIFYRTT
jgi:hypothetical protein